MTLPEHHRHRSQVFGVADSLGRAPVAYFGGGRTECGRAFCPLSAWPGDYSHLVPTVSELFTAV
jgi:hypothetical protein